MLSTVDDKTPITHWNDLIKKLGLSCAPLDVGNEADDDDVVDDDDDASEGGSGDEEHGSGHEEPGSGDEEHEELDGPVIEVQKGRGGRPAGRGRPSGRGRRARGGRRTC